jgi:hypothetical protein
MDDPARFLKELRQLRDGAGLGPAELAARSHYPYDCIRAAEVGPALPDLPVLSAYVRGCGGTTEEWEERWRSLTSAPTLPLLAARPAGNSTAASAGARIGSISPAADTPDPSIIMAALDRVAEEMAVGNRTSLPSRSEAAAKAATALTDVEAAEAGADAGRTEATPARSPAIVPAARTPTSAPSSTATPNSTSTPTSITAPASITASAVADVNATERVSTAASVPVVGSGRVAPALSWTAIAILIVVAICVITVLAVFA